MGKLQLLNNCCDRRDLEWQQVINYFKGNGWAVSYHEGNKLEKPLVDQEADMVIVASCAGLGAFKDWNERTVAFINKTKNPRTKLIIGGCLPKIDPSACEGFDTFDPRSFEKLDDYTGFPKKFNEFPRPNTTDFRIKGCLRTSGCSEQDEERYWRIQVHQGCSNKCAYCVIRTAIGPLKSKPLDEIMFEFKKGVDAGYKTICFDGDSISCYGKDIGSSFGKLLDSVWDIIKDRPDIKISVPDYHPAGIADSGKQILQLAKNENLIHLYIPIQSGSQKILDFMNRDYNTEDVVEFIRKIKNEDTKIRVGTSFIVGFPGETPEDLEATISFIRKVKLDYAFMHPCSIMDKTKAASLPDQLSQEEIWKRCFYVRDQLKDYSGSIILSEEVFENNKDKETALPLVPNYELEHS